MKLVKSLLLGSAAAIVAGAGAQAADLPARKAAPVEYVRVCDAYGAGFFYIPGTDTCIKVGGRVRADYAFSGRQAFYTSSFTATTTTQQTVTQGPVVVDPTTGVVTGGSVTNTRFTDFDPRLVGSSSEAANLYGWEARGRVDLDARTQTAWGTVQAVASLRLARTTGVLAEAGPSFSSTSANPTLEAAYIRFAGFTFGAARDNFAFMPSTFYGAGHWASFANGAKQLAYTAVLGGGLSATIALQDATDTTAGGVTVASYLTQNGTTFSSVSATNGADFFAPTYAYNNLPQINGRLDWDQGWGSASLMGAVGRAVAVNSRGIFDESKTVWAIGAGLKLNLPMIAAGDVLYLNAAYADGMTEYTTNWTSFKGSDTRRNVGGFVLNHPSWINTFTGPGVNNNGPTDGRIETLKSWNVAGIYTHYWTPQWRHSFLASYGQIDGTAASRRLVFGQAGAFGDATVWNVGTQLAWLPTRNFEIGVDVLYARVAHDVRTFTAAGAAAIAGSNQGNAGAINAGLNAVNGTVVTRESEGNWTGRLRVERTF